MMLTRAIALVCGAGLSPVAPGTAGSVVGVLLGAAIIAMGGVWALLICTVAVYFIGEWAVSIEIAGKADHDPSEIVIDEVAGQFLTMLPLALGLSPFAGDTMQSSLGALILAFVLFRAFDIIKPWPVALADRGNDARAVMLDDIVAAIMAALCIVALHFILSLFA